jgi:hypothetical protein
MRISPYVDVVCDRDPSPDPGEVSSTDEVFQNVKVILEFFGVHIALVKGAKMQRLHQLRQMLLDLHYLNCNTMLHRTWENHQFRLDSHLK